jgi:hypothetical protein
MTSRKRQRRSRPVEVFLSHSAKDKKFLRRLAASFAITVLASGSVNMAFAALHNGMMRLVRPWRGVIG